VSLAVVASDLGSFALHVVALLVTAIFGKTAFVTRVNPSLAVACDPVINTDFEFTETFFTPETKILSGILFGACTSPSDHTEAAPIESDPTSRIVVYRNILGLVSTMRCAADRTIQ
jgi:hypothetical protein